jgi:hypothetical protein
MPQASKSIEARITTVRVAITGVLADNKLQTRLARYGHDADHMQQGQMLLQRAAELQQQQQTRRSSLLTTNQAYTAALKQLYADYAHELVLARLAFKGQRDIQQRLDLDRARKEAIQGWLGQARQFYTNVLADEALLQTLAAYGLTEARLEASMQKLSALETQRMVREQTHATAMQTTKERDAALRALESWMRKFRKVALLALEDEPALLARIGVSGAA